MEVGVIEPRQGCPGPKSLHDLTPLKGDVDDIRHIRGFLETWDQASQWRGTAGDPLKGEIIKSFRKREAQMEQPTWVRQWINLAYSADDVEGQISESGRINSTVIDSSLPEPSQAQYAVFFDYYAMLQLDQHDREGRAKGLLYRKTGKLEMNVALALGPDIQKSDSTPKREQPSEPDSLGDPEHMEVDGLDATAPNSPEKTIVMEGIMHGEYEHREEMECELIESSTVPSAPTNQMGAASLGIHPPIEVLGACKGADSSSSPAVDSPIPTSRPKGPGSDASGWETRAHHNASVSVGSDSTMKTVVTNYSSTSSPPRAIPDGPQSIFDLDGILKQDRVDTAHLYKCLQRWKCLNIMASGTQSRRASRSVQTAVHKEQMVLVDELKATDARMEQPSWASQWIQFVLSPCPSTIEFDAHYHHYASDFHLFLEFFSALMERTLEARHNALTMLNNTRKREGLELTMELPVDIKREFNRVGEGVDFDEMMWDGNDDFSQFLLLQNNTNVRYSYSSDEYSSCDEGVEDDLLEGLKSNRLFDYYGRDIGNKDAPGVFRRNYKIFKPKLKRMINSGLGKAKIHLETRNSGSQVTFTPRKPWKRPLPLPDSIPLPTSSKEADICSEYAPLLREMGRPEPKEPHVWAMTRPELCETATYFRSFQSGVHADKRSRMVGYLVDGFPSRGDIWAKDGRLIVSHGGGASKLSSVDLHHEGDNADEPYPYEYLRLVPADSVAYPRNICDEHDTAVPNRPEAQKKKKAVAPSRDQSRYDSSTRNLIQAKKTGTPIVLLVGEGYRWWPLQMKQDPASKDGVVSRARYAVLGWYLVRDFWEEYEPGEIQKGLIVDNFEDTSTQTPLFVRCKFAFEWIEAQGTPWWIRTLERVQSKTVARNPELDIPVDMELSTPPVETLELNDSTVSPSPEDKNAQSSEAPIVEHICPSCSQVSPLIYHQGWFCTNQECEHMGMFSDGRLSTEVTLSYTDAFIDRPSLPEPTLKGLEDSDVSGFTYSSLDKWSVVPRYSDNHETYEREHWNGRYCHNCGRLNSKVQWNRWVCASCNVTIEEAKDTIYPATDFVGSHVMKHPGMYGLTKEDSGTLDEGSSLFYGDLPFGGRVYLIRPASGNLFDPLFEEYQKEGLSRDMFRRSPLKSAYVSGQHTSHFQHNGGVPYNFSCHVTTESFEDGPLIVRKTRDILESTASRILDRDVEFNEVLSCAYKKEQKMNFHSDNEVGVQGTIAALSLGSPAKMTFRPRPRKGEETAVCMEIWLEHGDILIMDGIGIQENYQHRVVPKGLRFAATARMIERPTSDPEPNARRWKAKATTQEGQSD